MGDCMEIPRLLASDCALRVQRRGAEGDLVQLGAQLGVLCGNVVQCSRQTGEALLGYIFQR